MVGVYSFERAYFGMFNLEIVIFSIMQYSRNVSQTRWIIDDERMGEASVEVIRNADSDSFFSVE